MSKEKRQRVLLRRDELSIDDLFHQQSFDDVILKLQELAHKYEEGIFTHDHYVAFEVDHYGYDGGKDLDVVVYRWETDAEYDKRMAKDAAAKEKARKARETKKANALKKALESEAEERALFEQLKAKFGE